MTVRTTRTRASGIPVTGPLLVAAGVPIAVFGSLWIAVMVALIGFVAFGGVSSGRWT